MEINFSFHAFERVLGRISMTHKELSDLLEADLAINIGQESNSNRAHKLFYSDRDKICFVAIQDVKTGTIVTVLPIDYHENISWAISIEAQNQARKLAIKSEATQANIEILNSSARVFKISGTLVDDYGQYKKTIKLGSWPCLPYADSIDALIKDEKFLDFLVENMKTKVSTMNDNASFLHTIAIRLGKKGETVFFSTSEIIELNADKEMHRTVIPLHSIAAG